MENPYPTPVDAIVQTYSPNLRSIDKLKNEKTIDHNKLIKPKEDGDIEKDNFLSHFFINDERLKESLALSIHLNKFMDLFDASVKLVNGRKIEYVSLFRIHYGIVINAKGSMKLLLIFQPGIAIYDGNPEKKFVTEFDPDYFRIFNKKSNNFETVTREDVDNILIFNYENNIKIMHSDELTPSKFRTGLKPDEKNDTRSATFSFQELFTLMFANSKQYDDIVELHNVMYICPNYAQKHRHGIILSPDYFEIDKLSFHYPNQYANRAYLCPPDCEDITIDF